MLTSLLYVTVTTMNLSNFGPIFYINLDRSPDRRAYIENHFSQYSISNFQRVPAIDGSQPLDHLMEGPIPTSITNKEIAVTLSHLKAMQRFLSYKEATYAVICEDDVDLSLSEFWPFNWNHIHQSLPGDCECLQLAVVAIDGPLTIPLHKRAKRDWSTVCYVLTRQFAQRVIDQHVINNKFVIKDNPEIPPVAETVIYNNGTVYTMPIVAFATHFESEIHSSHVEAFHIPNRDLLYNWWKEQSTLPLPERFNPLTGKIFGQGKSTAE